MSKEKCYAKLKIKLVNLQESKNNIQIIIFNLVNNLEEKNKKKCKIGKFL